MIRSETELFHQNSNLGYFEVFCGISGNCRDLSGFDGICRDLTGFDGVCWDFWEFSEFEKIYRLDSRSQIKYNFGLVFITISYISCLVLRENSE